jgi:hypothetical protein
VQPGESNIKKVSTLKGLNVNSSKDKVSAGILLFGSYLNKLSVQSLTIKNGLMAHKPVPIAIQNSWSLGVQITTLIC